MPLLGTFETGVRVHPETAIEEAHAKTPLRWNWGVPPKTFGRVGSEKPDRSWSVGKFRGKVHSEMMKVIHSEGEDCKAESLFWGYTRRLDKTRRLR